MFVWVGKKKMKSLLLAELRLYWPSYVCIGRVALYRPSLSPYDSDRFSHINTVLLIIN